MGFKSKSDGKTARGKWSAQPEPFAIILHGEQVGHVYDPEKIPMGLTLDLSARRRVRPLADELYEVPVVAQAGEIKLSSAQVPSPQRGNLASRPAVGTGLGLVE
jgi:hypothetical protein